MCCEFLKLVSVTLLSYRLHMDKGPCLLLAGAVSPVLIPCLILSGYSIKMTWMNKSCTTLATCHLVAKSYVIIEVAANSVQNAYSPLWALNSWPTRWHQALYPAVVTDHNRSAICPLPSTTFQSFPSSWMRGSGERGAGRRWWGYWVCPAPQRSSLLYDCGLEHLESALSII